MRSGIKDYRISQIGMREPKILVLVVNGLSLSYETLQDLKAALQLATTNMESADGTQHNFPLQGRQGSRGCIPGSPGESGLVSRLK